MNEEELKVQKIYNEFELKAGVHIGTEERLIIQAIDKGFQKGKFEQKKEELEFLKVFTQRDMHLHIKESDGTPRIVCDYNLILDRIKQLQKEIGGGKTR